MDDLELYEENEFETAKDAGKTMKRFIGSLICTQNSGHIKN